jgi:cellulose synthase operon protein YhjQ
MDPRGTDKVEQLDSTETPEDVAVLYSWANLHGAKYRDFSASRREYRAQLRHRAAEQVREQALLAQAEAEAAAKAADSAARKAAESAQGQTSDSSMQRSLREAEEAARTAAAERVEAARRAEAAAVAEAAARREEREIAEAHASAQRQAARYAESEIRRREVTGSQIPGPISDPYTPQLQASSSQPGVSQTFLAHSSPVPQASSTPRSEMNTSYAPAPRATESAAIAPPIAPMKPAYSFSPPPVSQRRPLGYSPDEASGVRQIYRGPEFEVPKAADVHAEPGRPEIYTQSRASFVPPPAIHGSSSLSASSPAIKPLPEQPGASQLPSGSSDSLNAVAGGKRHTDPKPLWTRPSQQDSGASSGERSVGWPSVEQPQAAFDSGFATRREGTVDMAPQNIAAPRPVPSPQPPLPLARPVSPFSQPPVTPEPTRGRRAHDDFGYQPVSSYSDPPQRMPDPLHDSSTISSAQRTAYGSGPAWLYAPSAGAGPARPAVPTPVPQQSSVAETLQHSRERVAARWYALKGIFEQPGQEQPEPTPVRQKETRTPVLAVFSLAGGVGKTSLVATVGRSLSSLGEKVLLTDTTSHGLLPFYFGASELRQGTVRTFSPPSGSTDAPIYLVSYDVDEKIGDEAAQNHLIEEIISNSRGTHRILLDLTPSSAWIVRHMARTNPTILVPLAPDMNSVISLQAIEKFFHGAVDADGRQLQPFYLLNQFDASLPLHLDVREVLRRQLGERLLPFVIRRAPAVSEALAEGMTVVDYAPESPVSEDYLNIATWLRTIAAPATAGFRNVRWSER